VLLILVFGIRFWLEHVELGHVVMVNKIGQEKTLKVFSCLCAVVASSPATVAVCVHESL